MNSKVKHHLIEVAVKKEAFDLHINKVIVALSGGADSITTAYVLKSLDVDIIALHCNFHLRGEESTRDMEFVKQFCDTNQIPLETKEFDVREYLNKNKGSSVEMACRDLRHRWFREKLHITGRQRIVTGHNKDDNIETFFLNVLRGSGSRGLKGMNKDNGTIWRPLLDFSRKEILEYLNINNLDFVVDSTNLKNDYRRNLLRNEIIPLLKKEWKGFDSAIHKTIKNLEAENNLIESFIKKILPLPNQPLPVASIIESEAPLLIIKRFIDPLGPFSTTTEEILSAIKANKPHIRRWKLKKGIVFLRNGNLFIEMVHGECCT